MMTCATQFAFANMLARILFLQVLMIVDTCGKPNMIIRDAKIANGASIDIEQSTFRFRLLDGDNREIAPAHAQSGLFLDGMPVSSWKVDESRQNTYVVETDKQVTASVRVTLVGGVVEFRVTPKQERAIPIVLNLGGMPSAHGLGDTGAYGPSFNLIGKSETTYGLNHNGHTHRWLSSFAIFPANTLAGVCFDSGEQKVILGPQRYGMYLKTSGPATFHYLMGDMKTIYKNYLELRTAKGYPNVKPKFRLFELGWESWDSLKWNLTQDSVQASIGSHLANGYPIKWAVTGSGFWETGGTTTSFGRFGSSFSNPSAFRRWLDDHDVKWMIGLRTNLVPSGGPFVPVSKKRDQNLKANEYKGNPLSDEAIEKGYVLTDSDGNAIRAMSSVFPQVPCLMLDGRARGAAEWYEKRYRLWEVDGIKEDTMMSMKNHRDIFNSPIARISDNGGLVMARCGSFSSPGTLLRINDTNGAASMQRRTPINYLQYAACGAPNVYSDTLGFGGMTNPESSIRHGWLLAVTAGMAVGAPPTKWSLEHKRLLKKIIDFHYSMGPYLYDAAMKSYETGFPYTLTPLSIAYPKHPYAVETPHFQWMIGESLLAIPLVKNYERSTLDIYLPPGIWYDYDTGDAYEGPKLIKNHPMPLGKTPCFVGGKAIVLLRQDDKSPLKINVFPTAQDGSSMTFNTPDGKPCRISIRHAKTASVRDVTTAMDVGFSTHKTSRAVCFDIIPGHDYRVTITPKLPRR